MQKFIIGIDEVGRGALAGPVMVAAVAMPANSKWQRANSEFRKLKDSKKLSAKQREAWYAYFKSHPEIEYTVARVYPRAIERMNISAAANLAALRAFNRFVPHFKLHASRFTVYLDGGLYLGDPKSPRQSAFSQRMSARTVVRGDEKIKAVSVASIIAKVHRDRAMARLAGRYPRYGFEVHKGYGTRAHLAAIKKYGTCEAHRKTFDPILRMS